jgi:hypothetical protein
MEQQRPAVLVPCISASIPAILLFKIATFIFQGTSTCENVALQSSQTQDKPTRDSKVDLHGKGIFLTVHVYAILDLS